MMDQRIPPSDTLHLIRPVEFARTPIRGAIILESTDKRNALLKKTGALKIGYSLRSDSTIAGIYLKFPQTDAQFQELDSLMGEPSIISTQGLGESFGSKGWHKPGCSIILHMDGPYSWPVEVPQTLVLRFRSSKDVKVNDL